MNYIKNIIRSITGLSIIFASYSCSDHKNQNIMTTQETSIFPKGNAAPKDWFTGEAFIHPLLAKDKTNDFALGSVTFEPEARTLWHTHPKGQVLIVTEGKGWYQEKGKPAQMIKKGDVINIPENVEHWHGASANTKMIHIAITNYQGEENVTWLKPVTDTEYQEVNKK